MNSRVFTMMKYPIPLQLSPSSDELLLIALSMRPPTILAMSMVNVLSDHCNSVLVTMSPFRICAISCQITALISSSFIALSNPLETATRLLFLLDPVAKALIS